MATVINNPGEGSGAGTIIGVIIAIILIALLFIYGLPAIRGDGGGAGTNVNVSLPGGDTGGTGGQ